jgi:signal transduction histidine kinase
MWLMAVVVTIAAAIIMSSLLIKSHRQSVRQQLQATAAILLSMGISDFAELDDFERLSGFIEDALQMEKVDKAVRVYDGDGALVFTTLGSQHDDLPKLLKPLVENPAFLQMEAQSGEYETIVVPYEGRRGKHFYFQVVIPLPRYSEVLSHMWFRLAVLLGILIGASMILSRVLAGRLLSPVVEIATYLKTLDPRSIDQWAPLSIGRRGQYLQAIIDGVNLLGTRTKEAIVQLGKMSRYVAHELRTPLTIMRGEAELMLLKRDAPEEEYRRVLASSLEEVRRMSDIVDAVLRVGADARSITMFKPASLDVVAWVGAQIPLWERSLGRGLPCDFHLPAGTLVRADPDLLLRLIDNLIRNVRDHASSDVPCQMSAELSDDRVMLSICDAGPGLSPEMLDSIRHDGASSVSAGVGLDLCFRIAEVSGLSLDFEPASGGGLCVRIGLPRVM